MGDQVSFLTVAYNRPEITAEQIRLMRKFVVNEVDQPNEITLWVVDNSDDHTQCRAIKAVCDNQPVQYFQIPAHQHYNPSASHGSALNWAVRNVFQKMSRFVVLLDHDCLPMKRVHVSAKRLMNNVYGLHQIGTDGQRYLWPGFMMFDRNLLPASTLDFLPRSGVYDTAGAIFRERQGLLNIDCGAKEEVLSVAGDSPDPQNETYSIIDERWLHWRNPQGTWKAGNHSIKDKLLWEKVRAL